MPRDPDTRHRRRFTLPAGFGFALRRLGYLVSRGLLSVRTRGLAATLRRVSQELRPASPAQVVHLSLPDPGDASIPAFEAVADPLASIIIPVYNQLEVTLACLRALAASEDTTRAEVVVVDDGSSDDTAAVLSGVRGLRYLRMGENSGFIAACNAGAGIARGRIVVFLNNDTAVQPGWLDALLDTFARHPDAGLVGARLIYPDGRLQEAGGILYSDGNPWNYGRFENPEDPAHRYVREVDYCSGAALAIERGLFEQLGGFDSHFAPAYFEDADLAMRVRGTGRRVYYQPASRVVHFEGISSGLDPLRGVKAHQTANLARFQQRWAAQLARDHAPVGTPPRLACDRGCHRRVLVIDVQVPRPDRDSGSLRMINLLRLLRESGCAVSFLPDSREHDGAYGDALEQLGVELWSRASLGTVPRWFARHASRFDVVIASRHYVAATYAPLVRRHAPRAKLVFDTVDLHFLREQREAELAGIDQAAAAATRERELRMLRAADASLVVSAHERELLATLVPDARVELLSNVHDVPGRRRGFDARRDLVFVGGFRHPPNVDAACWLVEAIWPRVRAVLPTLELHLVGDEAPARVQALGAVAGVHVRGFVPDLDPLMDGCRLALAPLRYGAGVKGKINLSMAHGQPVVATPCAVEGMHLVDGEDVLVATDAEDFAAAIIRLYQDPDLWLRLSEGGLANVERHFSFAAARQTLVGLLDELDPPRQRSRH